MIELTRHEERWLAAMAALDELTFLADWADVCGEVVWIERLAELIQIQPLRPLVYQADVPWDEIWITWADAVRWIRAHPLDVEHYRPWYS